MRLKRTSPRSRELRNVVEYEKRLLATHGKDWSRVALLAALRFLRHELATGQVFMHQAWSGPVFKSIYGAHPPVSLYTALPKRFCFVPVREAPAFLEKPCSKTLRRVRGKKKPYFWKLDFAA